MKKIFIALFILLLAASVQAQKYVLLETNLGNIKLKLNENTPKHSENFLKLVKAKHYDGLLFHRVVKDFMVQGGSSDSRNAEKGKMLGAGDIGYTVDAEILPGNIHKKGALCAARQGDQVNPEKKSSGEQFYIVQGKPLTAEELKMMEDRKLAMAKNQLGTKLFKPLQDTYKSYMVSGERGKADSLINSVQQQIEKEFAGYTKHLIPEAVKETYKTIGGTPFLDGEYTVFGEVVEGLDIIDKIAAVKTDQNDRPEEDVVILKATIKRK